MDFILEFLLELVVEGGMEASGNKKLSRWIRYPRMILTILFLVGIFLLVGAVAKIRQLYFTKK